MFPVASGALHRSAFTRDSLSVDTCETEQNCLQKTLSGPTVSLSENLIKISPGASSPPGDHAVVPDWGSQSNLHPFTSGTHTFPAWFPPPPGHYLGVKLWRRLVKPATPRPFPFLFLKSPDWKGTDQKLWNSSHGELDLFNLVSKPCPPWFHVLHQFCELDHLETSASPPPYQAMVHLRPPNTSTKRTTSGSRWDFTPDSHFGLVLDYLGTTVISLPSGNSQSA